MQLHCYKQIGFAVLCVGKKIKKRILYMRSSRIEQPTTVANMTYFLLSSVYNEFSMFIRCCCCFLVHVFTVYVNSAWFVTKKFN